MCLISSKGARSLFTIVPFLGAVVLAVIVIVSVHGSLGVVQLIEVDEVVVPRDQIVLAIGFLLGVVAEDDRDRRVDGPATITLDIDDTCDPVHGHQQLSLFNAHYDTRCFLPVHVYHVESGKPVAVLLRPGKTPSGPEVRTLLKHLVRRIRRHWPRTRIVFRGDSHYGRPQAMAWCEENGVDYIFGLAGNRVLHALAYDVADDLKVRRAEAGADRMRTFAAFAYAARSWSRKRRVIARLEATARGFDARYIVTSLSGEARHLYEEVYCARGQAENLIKLHKGQLASDRTSCQSPLANQLRLVLHTGAYWLMLALRDAIPRTMPLARAEFATLRLRLLKIGARVVERAARIRIHFASACQDAALFRLLAGRLAAAGP